MNKAFAPKTSLGKTLWDIKQKMIQAGQTTDEWEEVVAEIKEARGCHDV